MTIMTMRRCFKGFWQSLYYNYNYYNGTTRTRSYAVAAASSSSCSCSCSCSSSSSSLSPLSTLSSSSSSSSSTLSLYSSSLLVAFRTVSSSSSIRLFSSSYRQSSSSGYNNNNYAGRFDDGRYNDGYDNDDDDYNDDGYEYDDNNSRRRRRTDGSRGSSSNPMMYSGTVVYWNRMKGFGFLRPDGELTNVADKVSDQSDHNVYVHITALAPWKSSQSQAQLGQQSQLEIQPQSQPPSQLQPKEQEQPQEQEQRKPFYTTMYPFLKLGERVCFRLDEKDSRNKNSYNSSANRYVNSSRTVHFDEQSGRRRAIDVRWLDGSAIEPVRKNFLGGIHERMKMKIGMRVYDLLSSSSSSLEVSSSLSSSLLQENQNQQQQQQPQPQQQKLFQDLELELEQDDQYLHEQEQKEEQQQRLVDPLLIRKIIPSEEERDIILTKIYHEYMYANTAIQKGEELIRLLGMNVNDFPTIKPLHPKYKRGYYRYPPKQKQKEDN